MNGKSAALIVCATLALVSSAVHGALVQRTFVASDGLDGNPCTVNQPCRSFGIAIGKTVAGGEVIARDSAGYGIVTITKSVSIIAPPGVYAGISVFGGQTGVIVNGAGIVVVLRGLSINGSAAGSVNGIHLVQGARLRVEGCVISNLGSTGVVQGAAGSELDMLDTIVRDNGGAGVSLVGDATAVFDNLRAEHNAGDGVSIAGVTNHASATIRRGVLSHNGGAGVAATTPASGTGRTELVIEDSVVANNAGDGIFAGGLQSGVVEASVRHNSIASNGLSGVSAFITTGICRVHVTENTFSDHPINQHVKTDGTGSYVYASRNAFAEGLVFESINGGATYTFQDNTGVYAFVGTPPFTSFVRF